MPGKRELNWPAPPPPPPLPSTASAAGRRWWAPAPVNLCRAARVAAWPSWPLAASWKWHSAGSQTMPTLPMLLLLLLLLPVAASSLATGGQLSAANNSNAKYREQPLRSSSLAPSYPSPSSFPPRPPSNLTSSSAAGGSQDAPRATLAWRHKAASGQVAAGRTNSQSGSGSNASSLAQLLAAAEEDARATGGPALTGADSEGGQDEPTGRGISGNGISVSTGPSDAEQATQMRRLLVRQLTNLIMNHEPESIAESMAGTKVSGQMGSETLLLDGAESGGSGAARARAIDSVPLSLAEARAAAQGGLANEELSPDDGAQSFVSGQPGRLMGATGPVAQDLQVAASNLDQEASDEQESQGATPSPGSQAGGGGEMSEELGEQELLGQQQGEGSMGTQSGANGTYNNSDEYVTCPPDYEDQGFIEAASASNLTAEQQQQLLAGADSSGLLTSPNGSVSSSSAPPSSINNDVFTNRPPSQCVHPGSKMIEMITKVITPILFSIIIVVGLLGNIIVMLVILEDRKTERELTPTNLLILDLSLADLSFIIFCIPFTGWDYSVGHWVFGSLWCKFNQYLIVVCALSSIYTLVLMSVDRFMAVVYPIECISYRTSKNTLYAIYIKWILILIMASPTLPMHGLIDLPLGPDQYTCRFLADQYNPLHFQITFFVTSYLFPLVLIFCLYLSLLNKLWFGSKPHGHKESQKTLESKKRVTMLVASIVVVFALCWCPIQVMLILMRLKSHKITATYVAIQVFAHTLGYMNSCVNPIVYAFASETFHNSFKRSSMGRYLCCMCCSSSNQHNHPDHDRHSTVRSSQPNNTTSLLNHQISTTHPHHQHQLNNILSHHKNGDGGRHGAMCHDGTLRTTTLLMTPYKGGNENVNKIVSLPLEPRDRDVPPPLPVTTIADKSRTKAHLKAVDNTNNNNKSSCDSGAADSAGPSTVATQQAVKSQQPAKQQLVARVVQSSNQVSHQCEPCYQQELTAP